jgi:hypothetical protein
MTTSVLRARFAAPAMLVAALLGAGTLAACGGSGSSSGTSTSTSSAASGSAAAGGAGLFSSAAVQTCLKAAGITVPTGGARPSGSAGLGELPSGVRPSGARPSGGSGMPSGARPSGAGGGFGGADNAKIQAALKACGITLPTRSGAAAAPSAAG